MLPPNERRLANRYELARELGRGGMGVVYAGHDPVLRRDVAVKVVPPALLSSDAEERFVREAQTVAQMDHPGIVGIHDLGRGEDGSLFFVMPLVPGDTLRRLLKARTLRLGDALEIAIQVAEALEYSHQRGVVHRDIKPENVMITRDDVLRARVMDFGLARSLAEQRITKTGMVVGTAAYVSPEQAQSLHVDGRSDIYSLATVLYECVTGVPPFTGDAHAVFYRIVHEAPRPPRAAGAPIREELEAILMQCLEKERDRRPPRAGDVAESLRRHRSRLKDDEQRQSVVMTAGPLPARAPTSRFVGRERELAELQQRLNAACDGQSQLVVVSGEPGVGKSRLVSEIATLARVRKVRVLSGTFVETDRSFAYQGFCDLVQDYFRQRDDASSSSSSARADFSDLAPELVSLFPVLMEVPDLRPPSRPEAPQRTTPPDRTALFELLTRTLVRASGGKPLVLVLENLHGAEASLEALPYVVRRLRGTPTLVLATYRGNEVDRRHPLSRILETFTGDPRFLSIPLGPLTPGETRRLVESVVNDTHVAAGFAERLHQATDGNPFFAHELLRSLLESGGVTKGESGAWGFSSETALLAEAFPPTVQAAVERRIGHLSDDVREVLAVASVLGRSFEVAELAPLLPNVRLDDVLDRLISGGQLVEERQARGDRLSFTSGIVCDVLYAGLSRRRRRALHQQAAELLEAANAGRLERVSPRLVHHFSRGDVPEKTVEYGLLLCRRHLAAFNAEEATRVAKTVLEFLEDGGDAHAGEARFLLARAERMAGNLDAALRDAEAAAASLDGSAAAEALAFAAETAWQARRVDDARTFAERGIEKARAAEGASGDLARLLTVAATVASLRGEYARAAELSLEIQTATRRGEGERALPRGGTLVVGMCNPAPAVEPCEVTIDEEGEVLGNVFETLVTSDERGLLLPKLAESWKVANEGRTVDVVVRAGVAFSDGAPLDAAAVKASLVNALTRRPDLALASALAGAPEPSLEVVSERCLRMRLAEPLPIVASFLTDPALAIARAAPEGGTPLGTGPFMLDRRERASIHLVRNARSWKEAARLDGVEFRTSLKAPTAAAGLRSGALDLVRDLLPEDVDELLRDPRFRVFERAHKGTSFVQLNCASGPLADRALRRALAGAVRAQDLVWGSLGRFAIPATGLLPPATLGHDPGRRLVRPSLEDVRELVRSTGLATPIPLRAAVHPVYLDRYRALTRALLAAWHDAGVEVTLATSTMDEYGDAWTRGSADLLIGRWLLDYDDPDDATYILHHSRNGSLRAWFSSPETDQLLEEARAERRLASRDALYRRFEETLIEEAAVIPLFHDVDVRAAAAGIVGARLGSAPPYVNYAELAKEAARPSAPSARKGAVLRIPIAGRVADLDPVTAWTVEQSEVIPNVFETLTRDVEGAHVMPWLASEIFSERAGTRFRFRLRPGVRFHDGRPLTARDVRFTFERLLTTEGSHRYLLQNVRGARELLSGQASELSGFTIVSPSEFVVDLEEPVSFFPVLLSDAATAVLPEGTRAIGESFRDGAVGTGPFRLVRFDPEGRVELEKHTAYWRAGFPKSEGLVFRFGVSPQEIKTEFLAGRFSLASDLAPEDVDAFRADPALAAGYRESPLLSTYFVLLNPHTGALADELVRRRASEALRWAAPSVVKRTLGRLALPATELIPPGLLGASTSEPSIPTRPYAATRTTVQVHALRAAVHPVYFGEFAGFRMELERAVEEAGFFLRCESKSLEELAALRSDPTYDLLFTRWVADYPDADTFVHGALHTTQGLWGRWAGNEALDRLASRGRAEMDPVARHSIYRQAEERLFRDATLVPLFHEQVYRFARPEVEGLRVGFTHPVVAYENLS